MKQGIWKRASFVWICPLLFAAFGLTAAEKGYQVPLEVKLTPCQIPGLSEAFCGVYDVYENRTSQRGRMISLNIVVLPAAEGPAEPDPVFFFSGGPGSGVTDWVGFAPGIMPEIHKKRDFVFIDQRGTGKSNPLQCDLLGPKDRLQTYLVDMYPNDYVDACRKSLEKIADLTQYTTSIAMDDIHEVRAALGYDKINLFGISYGTFAVQTYMKRHPETVRSAVMNGVAWGKVPQDFARNTQSAMNALIQDCAADEACAKTFPNFAQELDAVLKRFHEGPVQATVENPDTKQAETVSLTFGPFIAALRSMLYDIGNSARIPLLIQQTAAGDYGPAALASINYKRGVMGLADGLYLCITCSEDVPFVNVEKALADAKGSMLGDYRVVQQVGACKRWPRGEVPSDFNNALTMDAPVLLISGEHDPVTPPASGDALARGLPNALHVVVANESHGAFGAWPTCLKPMVTKLFESGSVSGIDAGCAATVQRPPFILE